MKRFGFLTGGAILALVSVALAPMFGDNAPVFVSAVVFSFVIGVAIGCRASTGRWPDFSETNQ